jgi:hypothetical protein
MAKKLRPSDFAPARPEKAPPNSLTDTGQMASVPRPTPEAKAAATRYLTRKGHGDLLPMLGLALEDVPRDAVCPTCHALEGQGCVSAEGKSLHRRHVARARLIGKKVLR